MELLTMDQRHKGLSTRTPLNVLPDDLAPEWTEACGALDAALTALLEYDGEHDDILSESWQRIAEQREAAYVRAIQSGAKPPSRPRGGYVADAADKRPAIVGKWFALARELAAADSAAWAVMVAVAPLAIPDAHAAIVAAGEAYKNAEKALESARDAFVAAFSHRRNLEQFARGTDAFTGFSGLPRGTTESVTGERLPASITVPRALEWLAATYGPADMAERLPATRTVRGQNGVTVTMAPSIARALERNGNGPTIEYVDGFQPETQLRREGSARLEMTDNG